MVAGRWEHGDPVVRASLIEIVQMSINISGHPLLKK